MELPAIKIKVRWSDLDANMHLANSSYMNFTSFARTERLNSIGLSMEEMKRVGIALVIYHENFSYFKEIMPHQLIYVGAEITGLSEFGELFEFTHNFYSIEGKNLCKSYILGTCIDYKTRKRVSMPEKWIEILKRNAVFGYKKLTIEELKKLPHRPMDVDPKSLNFFAL